MPTFELEVGEDKQFITDADDVFAWSRYTDTVYRISEWVERPDDPNVAIGVTEVTYSEAPDDIPYNAYDVSTDNNLMYDGATELPCIHFEEREVEVRPR